MAIIIMILVLSGVCVGGWRYRTRRCEFNYDKLDAEIDALRRAIKDEAPETD